VFRSDLLPKGHRGIVFGYDVQPIVSGLDHHSARSYARRLNSAYKTTKKES